MNPLLAAAQTNLDPLTKNRADHDVILSRPDSWGPVFGHCPICGRLGGVNGYESVHQLYLAHRKKMGFVD